MLWSWHAFWTDVTDTGFARAAWATLWMAALAEAGAVVGGFTLALMGRMRWRPLRLLACIYIWVIRGTPLLIQLLVIYFGIPALARSLRVTGCGLLGLVINESAYLAVLCAACLDQIPQGHVDAARALGLGRRQTFRWIEAPQAVRLLLPLLGNQFNTMMKTTALLSVIAFSELLQYAENTVSTTYRPTEAFATAALYYLALTAGWSGVQALLERRHNVTRSPNRRVVAAATPTPEQSLAARLPREMSHPPSGTDR
jgi:polar amino acid transport system permease protein